MLLAQVVGNIGGVPELKYSQNGTAMLIFNVASNGRRRNAEGAWVEETTWVRVTIFAGRAETLQQYLFKGMRVFATGRLEARPWTDRDGALRPGLELTASDIDFMSPAPEEEQTARPRRSDVVRQAAEAVAEGGGRRRREADMDDLPF